MGTRGSVVLILLLLLCAWFGKDAAGFHLDPVRGPPSVCAKLDSVFRDSLRARALDLFPADSLDALRGEPGERTPAVVSRILARTGRAAMGWIRVDPLVSDYHRTWLIFWAERTWILRGEAFRATAEGIVSQRFEAVVELPQGFVGTTSSQTHPATSQEFGVALDSLSRRVAARVVPVLLGSER